METAINQTHGKKSFLLSLSRMFERASYYGMRSVVVVYIARSTVNIPEQDAIRIYSWFIASIIFSQIIGAVLGDLVLGNKKAMLIGGILQSLGAFSFCIPSTVGMYMGLALLSLGVGLYSPNILSLFGKLYTGKQKLLDAGFMIFYVAVNFGVFAGSFLVGYFGSLDVQYGFTAAGILMLIAVAMPLFLKEVKAAKIVEQSISGNSRIWNILITIILLGLFWTIYEMGSSRIFDLEMKFSERSAMHIPASMWYLFNSVFLLPVGIIAAIIWSYFYNSQFVKLTLGFLIAALSFAVLFLIPDVPADEHVYYYLISLFLLSVAEIHISPAIYSAITRYGNPKYLAILMSLTFLPAKLFALALGLFNFNFNDKPIFALQIALVATLIIGLGLAVLIALTKKTHHQQ